MCQACPREDIPLPSAWYQHIVQLYRLQRAEYPFGKDDLTWHEWLALAEMKDAIEITDSEQIEDAVNGN